MSSPIKELEGLSLDPTMRSTRPRGGRRRQTTSILGDLSNSDSDPSSPGDSQPPARPDPRGPPPDPRLRSSAINRRDLESQAVDIVSAFVPDILPSNFRLDEQATISTIRDPRACLVPLDLQATVLRLAVNNPPVFQVLREAQPPASCAEILFEKLRKQIYKIFEDWDIFCRYGLKALHGFSATGASTSQPRVQRRQTREATSGVTITQEGMLTIEKVLSSLRSTTNILHREIISRRPHGAQAAAECILYILNKIIIQGNRDAFEGNTWNRRPPRGEREEDRNLFWQIIVAPSAPRATVAGPSSRTPRSTTQPDTDPDDDDQDDETKFFGLLALEALPTDVLVPRLDDLERLKSALDASNAPTGYRSRCQRLLNGLRGSRATTAGRKRGYPTEEGAEEKLEGEEGPESSERRGERRPGTSGGVSGGSGRAATGGGKRGREVR